MVNLNSRQKANFLFASHKGMFLFGLTIVIIVSIIKILDMRYNVFMVYKHGALDFWQNINPYSNWRHPYDKYLYGPVFSVLFTPLAILPSWLGAFLWNLLNFILFYYSIKRLPESKFNDKSKTFFYWFLFPIALTDLFYFQCNLLVTSCFILAYSLLEKNKAQTGLIILLFSGFSKIYGLTQLGTLLFYSNKKRNLLFTVILSATLFLFPIILIPISELIAYYQSWFTAISARHNPLEFEVIYRLIYFIGIHEIVHYILHIQIVTVLIICIFTILNYKKFSNINFRTRVIGIVMGWVILFSTTAEKHTYIVAMAGMLLWYITENKTLFKQVLIWSNFFIIILVPIDAIIPKSFMRFIYDTLHLNLILFGLTWLYMFSRTFISPPFPFIQKKN